MSLLNDLKSKQKKKSLDDVAYARALQDCPPVSAALLAYLDKMFARKYIEPNNPNMSQELIFQAGIDKIKNHLRTQNDRQEKEIRDNRTA